MREEIELSAQAILEKTNKELCPKKEKNLKGRTSIQTVKLLS